VTRIFADHFPFLSHVEETAAWLKGVLEEIKWAAKLWQGFRVPRKPAT